MVFIAYENFAKLITYYRKFQEANLFPIIAVTGPLGQGKSSFSMQCAIKYCEIYLNEKHHFSVNKYIAYNDDEILSKYYNLPEYSPLIGDEAARFAMSQDWNKAINKEVKKTTMQLRPRRLLFFMNIPHLMMLDKVYRDYLINMWVWIPTRGYAVVFKPDENPRGDDRWHFSDFKKWKYRIDQFTDIDKIYSLVQKHQCFFDVFKFPKVPEEIFERYMELRQKKTFIEQAGQYAGQKDVAKVILYNIYYNWNRFKGNVKEGKTPTTRLIERELLKDPVKGIRVLTHSAVCKWLKEIGDKVPEQKTLEVPQELPDANY